MKRRQYQELAEETRKTEKQAAAQSTELEGEAETRRTSNAGARCASERERFEYVLAFNGEVGSVPRSVLAADQDSLLYKMYGGDWDYARDKTGRALVTCHPQRWAAILEHLTTGAVPAEWDPQLLAQARHWNSSRLVDGLEALSPGVVVTSDPGSNSFKARCTFVSVISQLAAGTDLMHTTFTTDRGRWWGVEVNEGGVRLWALMMPGEYEKSPIIKAPLLRWRVLLRSKELLVTGRDEFNWDNVGYSYQQLVTDPLARARDSLVLEVEVRFE